MRKRSGSSSGSTRSQRSSLASRKTADAVDFDDPAEMLFAIGAKDIDLAVVNARDPIRRVGQM
jgi:hypothetical protein